MCLSAPLIGYIIRLFPSRVKADKQQKNTKTFVFFEKVLQFRFHRVIISPKQKAKHVKTCDAKLKSNVFSDYDRLAALIKGSCIFCRCGFFICIFDKAMIMSVLPTYSSKTAKTLPLHIQTICGVIKPRCRLTMILPRCCTTPCNSDFFRQ